MALDILKFAAYCFILLIAIYPIVDRICDALEFKYTSIRHIGNSEVAKNIVDEITDRIKNN